MLNSLPVAVSIVVLAGSLIGGQTSDVAIPVSMTTAHHDCTFLFHNLTVEEERNGLRCTGTIPVYSCSGMCHSEIEPHYFLSRSVLVKVRHHFHNYIKAGFFGYCRPREGHVFALYSGSFFPPCFSFSALYVWATQCHALGICNKLVGE